MIPAAAGRAVGRGARRIGLLLVCLAARAQEPGVPEGARFVELLVRGAAAQADLDALASELAESPAAVPAYLGVASGLHLPATPAGLPRPLVRAESELLGRIAPRLPREEVIAHVRATLPAGPGGAWRMAALELLAAHAGAADVGLLIDAVSETDLAGESEPLLRAFRSAMIELLERERGTLEQLGYCGAVSANVVVEIVRAVGRAGDPRGLTWLAQQLGDPDLTTPALQEMERLAPRSPPGRALGTAEKVRPFLWAEEAAQRRHAMGILAELRDPECIPRLIEILEQAESSEREAAHHSLQRLSGCGFPQRASIWRSWHGEELRWWDEEGPAILEDLASESPSEVLAAVRSASERCLHRDRLALELARLVREHESPAVRTQACAGLARLGSRAVTRDLVAALEDGDPAVRSQALQALRAITGSSLPADRSAWSGWLRTKDGDAPAAQDALPASP